MSIKETIVAQSSKIGFVLKKHAPEIITGVGITASIASTILAVKETPKAMKITESLKENLASVEEIKSKRDKDQNFVYADGTKTSYTDKEVLSDKLLTMRRHTGQLWFLEESPFSAPSRVSRFL